jgi:glucan-binding YG repeat protein
MQTLKVVIIILTLTTFFSCDNSTSTKKVEGSAQNDSIYIDTTKKESVYIDTSNVATEKIETINKTKNEVLEDTITNINFKELAVSINRLIVFDKDKELNKTQKDTVYLYSELGETIEGQTLSVSTDKLTNLTIEQRYETSVTIIGEGPHCDLIDWKHYNSEWKMLKSNKVGQFICDSYSEKDWEKFPKIQISELKTRVKKHCEEGFYNLILKIKSPTEYPSGVGVSRYFLRLTGQRKDNGQTVTKLIIFEVAMGC